jgi:oxygen-independent coproporphyrinogen-3 oxidase
MNAAPFTTHPILAGSPYQAYVYAYPHKTAYRPFEPFRSLREVWENEDQRHLFLYVHIPFCTMRCGFCNLFTTANPNPWQVSLYLDTLRVHAQSVRVAMPNARFARFVIGGGTPTYLNADELRGVFEFATSILDVKHSLIPSGIETSPDTLTRAHSALFDEYHVDRVSIGIQSFIEEEAANSGRPQKRADIDRSLELLKHSKSKLNLDLIYGLPGQTRDTWRYSLQQALQYEPDELYLYPLYVRPLTGLGRSHKEWDDIRLACYRDLLLSDGRYQQVSMRMFRRKNEQPNTGPIYCCQEDGMVGLGCGARSYTQQLHYSLDYAVHPKNVKEIITDYNSRTVAEFALVEHGFELNGNEQRRRYVLQSILNNDGLDARAYQTRFGMSVEHDFPDLPMLAEIGLLRFSEHHWKPTELGLERSDALGPWFFSPEVKRLMEGYQLK